jgi:hypothetical protein
MTTSILNLGFKTFAPKILAHTKCINTENTHKYLQQQNQAKTHCKTGKTCCKDKTRQNLLQNHQNIGACIKY